MEKEGEKKKEEGEEEQRRRRKWKERRRKGERRGGRGRGSRERQKERRWGNPYPPSPAVETVQAVIPAPSVLAPSPAHSSCSVNFVELSQV